MGTYYAPYNHTKKEYIDWINRTELSDKIWINNLNSDFLAYLLQYYWRDSHVELVMDDNWEEYENYKDVTDDAIKQFNRISETKIELVDAEQSQENVKN